MTGDNLGKCSKCHQDNTGEKWCHSCNVKQFQNEFDKWTSGDQEIDKFIQQIQLNANKYREIIEWIPFERLGNVRYLAEGGFGTVYEADWLDGFIKSTVKSTIKSTDINEKGCGFDELDVWYRKGEQSVCLKCHSNSTNKNGFLQEIKNQLKFRVGLTNIHEIGLMHKDFHPGNIVNQSILNCYITDFGLCKPITENDPEKIYGVIPYMSPETLSRGEYTQASDIYSVGMVMLEVLTSYPPYYNTPHDLNLAMKICEGYKPEIKCEIPQIFKEIIEKCWNFEPLNRPTAEELISQLSEIIFKDNGDEQIEKQFEATNRSNKNFIQYDPNEMHPGAIYTSRHLPFLKSKKFETHDTKQWDFVVPNSITYELITGDYDIPHDRDLARKIYNGL
ncbi:hypothetical protein Glove_365g30 [Diversispora epigaea]|uniref:Protein kinase domain-containing protein n=1 Tax=Diversispora epigaea TaxID=1348612 RepID=A0A397HAQ9_9GLOM|nr:hypothetical protein Glove_365g30 [Diversispora epigaea]